MNLSKVIFRLPQPRTRAIGVIVFQFVQFVAFQVKANVRYDLVKEKCDNWKVRIRDTAQIWNGT